MSKLLVSTLLCLASCCAYARSSADGVIAISLSSPGQSQNSEILRHMQDEVARLLEPGSLMATWVTDQEASQSDFARLVAVTLEGACSSEPVAVSPSLRGVRALASTDVVDGRILPFARLHCEALRQFMSPALRLVPSSDRPMVLGRAMGRLVAHELYHMVGQTKHHRASGAARSCFNLSDLTGEGFEFDPAALTALHAGHAGAAADLLASAASRRRL